MEWCEEKLLAERSLCNVDGFGDRGWTMVLNDSILK